MLTASAYVSILVKRIVIEGSAVTNLEKFYPLTSGDLKRVKGAQDKL